MDIDEYLSGLKSVLEKFINTNNRFIGVDGRLIFYDVEARTWYGLNLPSYPGNPFHFNGILEAFEGQRADLGQLLSNYAFNPTIKPNSETANSILDSLSDFEQFKQAYSKYILSGLAFDDKAGELTLDELDRETVEELFPGNQNIVLKGRTRARLSKRPPLSTKLVIPTRKPGTARATAATTAATATATAPAPATATATKAVAVAVAVAATTSKVTSKMAEQARAEDLIVPADFPFRSSYMPPYPRMFARLQEIALNPDPDWDEVEDEHLAIVRRTFPEEYDNTDSITDHFAEKVRIACRERREISPAKAWIQIKESNVALPSDSRARREMVYEKARGCNLFNTALGVYLLSHYGINGNPSTSVLDSFAGWGDRLISSLAVGVKVYRGWDTNPALQPVYNEIGLALNADGKTDWTVELGPFESAVKQFEAGGDLANQFDTALFSPPFFDKEVYQGPETSTKLHDTEEAWYNDFYRPSVLTAAKGLKSGGHFLAYITSGRMFYEANDVLKTVGFDYLGSVGFQQVVGGKGTMIRETYIWQAPVSKVSTASTVSKAAAAQKSAKVVLGVTKVPIPGMTMPTTICLGGNRELKTKTKLHEWGASLEKAPANVVYIGRAFNMGWRLKASKWMNPYKVTDPAFNGDIEAVLKAYREYILAPEQKALFDALPELSGKKLACWCHPEPCHGDVLASLFKEYVMSGKIPVTAAAAAAKLPLVVKPGEEVVVTLSARGNAPWTSATTSPNPTENTRSVIEPAATIPPVPGTSGSIPTMAEAAPDGSVPYAETPFSARSSPSTGAVEVEDGEIGPLSPTAKASAKEKTEIKSETEIRIEQFGRETPAPSTRPAATAATAASTKPTATPASTKPSTTTSIRRPLALPTRLRTSVATPSATATTATPAPTPTATTATASATAVAVTYDKDTCKKNPMTYEELYRQLLPGKALPNDKSLICSRIENALKKMQQEQTGGNKEDEYQFYELSELPSESFGSESKGKSGRGISVKKPFDILTTVVEAARYLEARNIPPEITDTVIKTIMNSETGKKLMPFMEKLKESPELKEQLFSLLKMAYNDISSDKQGK